MVTGWPSTAGVTKYPVRAPGVSVQATRHSFPPRRARPRRNCRSVARWNSVWPSGVWLGESFGRVPVGGRETVRPEDRVGDLPVGLARPFGDLIVDVHEPRCVLGPDVDGRRGRRAVEVQPPGQDVPVEDALGLGPGRARGDRERDVRPRLEGAVTDELKVPGGGPVHRQLQQQRAWPVRALLDLQLRDRVVERVRHRRARRRAAGR